MKINFLADRAPLGLIPTTRTITVEIVKTYNPTAYCWARFGIQNLIRIYAAKNYINRLAY